VQENLESQRRQYELVERARRYGFRDVAVIDADLGRSASGTVDCPAARTSPRRAFANRSLQFFHDRAMTENSA
jgi:hypothetical protein